MEEDAGVGSIEIREEQPSALDAYARVPIAFEVASRLVMKEVPALGGLSMSEEIVTPPWIKDYDVDSFGPMVWPAHFDLSTWGIFTAWTNGEHVGGAAVAWGSTDVAMLEGRTDLADLWDLRVHPDSRSRGVGTALFRAAELWSQARGARLLKVETQSINVPACRFYSRVGCTLGGINRFAYPSFPDETQLIWYKQLSQSASRADA
ncbi:MAG TPA: GNAT family N-acetyltransferase [Gemmatimonas sp.]|nr:GNAT family N-acetyltransferase [Gemmatimonas sp.]